MISEISKEVLKNAHTTLKWMWMIVMALAVKKAIEIFIYCIDHTTGVEMLRDWQHFYLQDVMLFIIFMLTIIRFYHGDSRYLDKTYLESQLHAFNPKTYSAGVRFSNIFWLATHAVLFYFLAASQRDLHFFFFIYSGLLLFNSIWLFIMYLLAPNKEEVRYPLYWAINNAIHVCLLITLYLCTDKLEASYSYIVFFILTLSNSFFDYFTTWNYYFPKIVETTQESPMNQVISGTEE